MNVFLVCWSWEDGYERHDVGSRLTTSRHRLLAWVSSQGGILWNRGNHWPWQLCRGEARQAQNYQDRGRCEAGCFLGWTLLSSRLPSRLLTSPSWTPPTWPRCTGRWRWWSWWTTPTLWSSTKWWRPRACSIWCLSTRPGAKYLVSNSLSFSLLESRRDLQSIFINNMNGKSSSLSSLFPGSRNLVISVYIGRGKKMRGERTIES